MTEDLILYKNNLILNYLSEGIEATKKSYVNDFIFCISELYKVPLFSYMINAVITKIKHKQAKFKLIPLKSWDRVLGHCTTSIKEEESVFKNNIFSKHYTIVIKKITPTIIIHEIGHAIEHIANINVNKDFKNCLFDDFKRNNTNSIQIKKVVRDVMQDQLKNYKIKDITKEFFARFFEMLAMSKEVYGWDNYQFKIEDISIYYSNTITWANEYLIPILRKKIDDDIENSSIELFKNVETKKWSNKFKSRFSDINDNKRKWQELKEETNKNVKDTINYFNKQNVSKLNNGIEYLDFTKKNN